MFCTEIYAVKALCNYKRTASYGAVAQIERSCVGKSQFVGLCRLDVSVYVFVWSSLFHNIEIQKIISNPLITTIITRLPNCSSLYDLNIQCESCHYALLHTDP